MALTVETGAGVLNADSYVTLVEIRAYALARGLTLPTADAEVEVLARRAKDYLESYGSQYKGERTYGLGYSQWPRYPVEVYGDYLTEAQIPQQLKDAQCQLAYEFQTVDPLATTSGQVVKREQIDVIEIEYAVNYREGPTPTRIPRVDALINPLLKATYLQVVRA